MVFKYFLFLLLVCALDTNGDGKEIDLNELATILSYENIPVRLPKSRFMFNKDRTPSSISTRIIGGNVAVPHAYPYQVAMYIMVENNLFFCGGSLITPEWVLTAAHCVEGASYVVVILGSHNLSQTELFSREIYNVSNYIIHKNWDSEMIRNDIALVKLPVNVTLNTNINTVPIACANGTYAGLIGRCLGWGKTILGSVSNVLEYVDAEVMTNEECRSYNEDYGIIVIDQHLCTSGEGYVGSCNGDSGGPLIINGTQVGIVSFGDSDCSAGSPSVYTRLTKFYEWVNENIQHYNKTCDCNASGQALKVESLSKFWIVGVLSCLITNFNSKWIS